MQKKWFNNSLCLPRCFWRESLQSFLMNWGAQKNLALGHIWLVVFCRLSWGFGFLSGRSVWLSLHRSCWTLFNFLIKTSVKISLQWLKIWLWILGPLKKIHCLLTKQFFTDYQSYNIKCKHKSMVYKLWQFVSAFNKHRRPTKSVGYFAQKRRLLFALS